MFYKITTLIVRKNNLTTEKKINKFIRIYFLQITRRRRKKYFILSNLNYLINNKPQIMSFKHLKKNLTT